MVQYNDPYLTCDEKFSYKFFLLCILMYHKNVGSYLLNLLLPSVYFIEGYRSAFLFHPFALSLPPYNFFFFLLLTANRLDAQLEALPKNK
jgi:hypothetical protein